jgi:hypothetical protein
MGGGVARAASRCTDPGTLYGRAWKDDDDWVGEPPEGHYTRDRAKPEFWLSQRPPGWILGTFVLVLIVLVLVILLA